MNNQISVFKYEAKPVSFSLDKDQVWMNATQMAKPFGKKPTDYLRTARTKTFIEALNRRANASGKCEPQLSQITNGDNGGTWIRRELAIDFARWLSADFAIWCDEKIMELLTKGKTEIKREKDWPKLRHLTAATNKLQARTLRDARFAEGKATEGKHYMCEAKLVNWACFGEFKGYDRESLSMSDLDLLAQVELQNTKLINDHYPYDQRKPILKRFAQEERARQTLRISKTETTTP